MELTRKDIEANIQEGWMLNPNEKVVSAILKRLNVTPEHYCPCHNPYGETQDGICPCKAYRIDKVCHCQLYVKK